MIPYEITNEIFLGSQQIFLYSLMLVLVIMLGAIILYVEVAKQKLNGKKTFWAYFWVFFGILFGARFFYTFGPWSDNGTFVEMLLTVLNPFHGSGLVMLGGLVFGFLFGFGYVLWRKLGVGRYADMAALIASMGLFLGRLGCYFAGCCFGEAAKIGWAVVRDGIAIHPTQIYSSIGNLFIFSYIVWRRGHQRFRGELFLHFVILYSVFRFIVEFFRFYEWHYMGLTVSQLILLPIFLIALVLHHLANKKDHIVGISQQKGWWWYIIGGGLIMNFGVYMISGWNKFFTLVLFIVGFGVFLKGMGMGLDFRWKVLIKSRGTKQVLKVIGIIAILFVLTQGVTYFVGLKLDSAELEACPHDVVGNESANIRMRVIDSPYCNLCWQQEFYVHPKVVEAYGDRLFIEKYDIRHCREIVEEYDFFGTPGYVFTNLETGDESIYYNAVSFETIKKVIGEIE